MIIHGSSGTRYTHVDQLFPLLDRAGYAWFSVDYGSAANVRAAIQYIRCPGRFNITSRMVLIADDTGAEVALSLAEQGGFQSVVVLGAETRNSHPNFAPPVSRFSFRFSFAFGGSSATPKSAKVWSFSTLLILRAIFWRR